MKTENIKISDVPYITTQNWQDIIWVLKLKDKSLGEGSKIIQPWFVSNDPVQPKTLNTQIIEWISKLGYETILIENDINSNPTGTFA